MELKCNHHLPSLGPAKAVCLCSADRLIGARPDFSNHYKAAPSLVVEVLSPTTSAFDRGAKFAAYRKLPSLREYALVGTERLSVDLFRRDDTGHWVGAVPV
jgi:Uma2 family endonuclease